jgi:hypothetical protein
MWAFAITCRLSSVNFSHFNLLLWNPSNHMNWRKHIWKVLYKDCLFCPDPLTNMAATGNSCFWLVYFLYPCSPNGEGVYCFIYTPAPRRGRGVYCFTSVLPSVQDIFRHIFLSHCWWQKSDIWSQASYRYNILWVAFLDPSDSYFLFADFVDFYTHWTYMLIFRRIFLSSYWWQKSDIWFLDPSDSYFLFAEERGYHRWALARSSSCLNLLLWNRLAKWTETW